MTDGTASIWIGLFSAFAAAVAAIFAGVQILYSRKQNERELLLRQRDRVFSYSIFKNQEYRVSRDVLRDAFGTFASMSRKISSQEIRCANEKHENIQFHIFACIAHWDRLATEIHLGLADKEAAFVLHHVSVTDLCTGFREFLEGRQKLNPQLYIDLLVIADEWCERRKSIGNVAD